MNWLRDLGIFLMDHMWWWLLPIAVIAALVAIGICWYVPPPPAEWPNPQPFR